MKDSDKKYKFIDPSRLYVQKETVNESQSPKKNVPPPQLNLNKEYHQEIMSYMDQVNDKTVLATLVQEEKLKQKKLIHLINQLERTQMSLIKLEEKYQQQESIGTHPQIKEDVENLQKVEQYKISLQQKASILNLDLDDNNKNILYLQQQVFEKRLLIRTLTQESWSLLGESQTLKSKRHHQSMDNLAKPLKNENLTFITGSDTCLKSQGNLRDNKTILPPILSKTGKMSKMRSILQNPNIDQDKVAILLNLMSQSREVNMRINKTKDEIARKCNKFSSTRNLLQDSIQQTMKYFENRQKIVGLHGYADSLYFDISTVNATTRSTMNESSILQPIIPTKGQKKNGSNIKNILYDKLQSLMLNMIKDKQSMVNHIDQQSRQEEVLLKADSMEQSIRNSLQYQNQFQLGDFIVSIEQFLKFSPQQIIGLLTLNPILLKELVSVFDIKQKSVGLNGKKVKILIQQNTDQFV